MSEIMQKRKPDLYGDLQHVYDAVRELWVQCTPKQRTCLIQGSNIDPANTTAAWYQLPSAVRMSVTVWLVERRNYIAKTNKESA